MRKRLKTKILLGFLVVICMLAAAGGMSIYEFIRISGLVKSLIKDNYKTIQAGKSMLEALERKDSGVLLLLLGEYRQGSEILHQSDSAFSAALQIAEGNITEPGEDTVLRAIRQQYELYSNSVNRVPGSDTSGVLKHYQQVIHASFINVKDRVHALINLNQEALFEESSQLEQQSRRALMPGIVAIVAALVFLLMLNFFISRFFVRPIVRLTNTINKYQQNPRGALVANIESEDEIGKLASAVEKLAEKLSH